MAGLYFVLELQQVTTATTDPWKSGVKKHLKATRITLKQLVVVWGF